MKFFGNGIRWNPQTNKVLCKFVDGVYETDNEDEIEILVQYYKFENNKDEDKETEIRAKAKELGIKNWHNTKIETLLIKIAEVGDLSE